MSPQKTLQQREKELRALLATPAGRQELEQLEARCQAVSGRLRPTSTSVITYILVHERGQGLITHIPHRRLKVRRVSGGMPSKRSSSR